MSTNEPLVSVIMPAFNAEPWIARTLWSVLNQTYDMLQVLVVDDGSSDRTPDIVNAIARRDDRVRLLHQQNAGPAAARNHALREATGAFVAPIDADDVWASTNVERQVTALLARPDALFSYARSVWIDADDAIISTHDDAPPPPCTYVDLLRKNIIGNGSACVFRRDALCAVGGYDARFDRGGEDWLLTLKLAARGPFICVPDHLIGYRQGHTTFSRARVGDMCVGLLDVIREMRRTGPPLPAQILRDARTAGLVWYLPRLRDNREWLGLIGYAAIAYLGNPLALCDLLARAIATRSFRPNSSAQRSARSGYAVDGGVVAAAARARAAAGSDQTMQLQTPTADRSKARPA